MPLHFKELMHISSGAASRDYVFFLTYLPALIDPLPVSGTWCIYVKPGFCQNMSKSSVFRSFCGNRTDFTAWMLPNFHAYGFAF